MGIEIFEMDRGYWGGKMRIWGELDKFLLKELPVEQILALKDCSVEDFKEKIYDLLETIGENLCKRLSENPEYHVCFYEHIRSRFVGCSEEEALRQWSKQTFVSGLEREWNKVITNKKFCDDLTKKLTKGRDTGRLLYLYGILVYARTLFEEKGGDWESICSRKF